MKSLPYLRIEMLDEEFEQAGGAVGRVGLGLVLGIPGGATAADEDQCLLASVGVVVAQHRLPLRDQAGEEREVYAVDVDVGALGAPTVAELLVSNAIVVLQAWNRIRLDLEADGEVRIRARM
jgi:hypothetical protein